MASLDAEEYIRGKHCAYNGHNQNADIHLSPRIWWIFHPIHVRAAPTIPAPQLAGEMTTPIRQPAPNVKNQVSQYFIKKPRGNPGIHLYHSVVCRGGNASSI